VTLALKHRPQRFDQLVGQRPVRVVLRQLVLTGDLPPALLFSGTRGTGKTTTGRILAAALNAPDGKGDVDLSSPVAQDILAARSSDVIEIDAASNGLVDDVRNLREVIQYSTTSEWRVVLLDEAHSMSREAFNALLKTLEEPPPRTVFVLLTTEPNRIPDTILSRCMLFEFTKLSTEDMIPRLREVTVAEGWEAMESELLSYLAVRADGSLRSALMSLDQASRVGITDLGSWQKLQGEALYGAPMLVALHRGDIARAYALLDEVFYRTGDLRAIVEQMVDTLTQVFVFRLKRAECPEHLLPLLSLDESKLLRSARVIWDLLGKPLERYVLQLMVAMLAEVLSPVMVPEPELDRPLTLLEMRNLRVV
jgi:DNA polymerase III subunit gamma/tau